MEVDEAEEEICADAAEGGDMTMGVRDKVAEVEVVEEVVEDAVVEVEELLLVDEVDDVLADVEDRSARSEAREAEAAALHCPPTKVKRLFVEELEQPVATHSAVDRSRAEDPQ